MLIHNGDRSTLIDFFVEAPGRAKTERTSELVAAPVEFTDSVSQVFNIGAASCGVPGTAAGLERALRDFGSMPLSELVGPAVSAARDGVEINAMGSYLFKILSPILVHEPESAEIYAPEGRLLHEGDTFRFPELADALELYGAEGSAPFYEGDIARRVSEWVLERGGTLAPEDLAGYEPVVREPVRARFRDREVVTNPPPSSGRNPHRICPRAARTDRLVRRRRVGRGHGPGAGGARRRLRPRAVPGGVRLEVPGPADARRCRRERLEPPRRDHAHHCDGRGRLLCVGHMLERNRLRPDRAGHRHPCEQHARRGRPEPAGLSPVGGGHSPPLDDVADGDPSRRRARGRARKRRFQPHPLGGRSGDPAPRRRRAARAGSG